MKQQSNTTKTLHPILRLFIEVGFIIFLFYSNLLMGEYTSSGKAWGKSLMWAIQDIFTLTNFIIAIILSIIGFLVFEFLRKRL